MAQQQTAIVVVSKDWFDGARHLFNDGRASRSTGETHFIIADLEDASNPLGVWVKNISSTQLKADGSKTLMRLMIPWAFIVALAIVDDDMQKKVNPGFAGIMSENLAGATAAIA